MDTLENCSPLSGLERIDQFALVSYIPDPLGAFLDSLRLHLAPDCKPHAHVTVLPPRPLCGSVEDAGRAIRMAAREFQPFSLRLGDVALFEKSEVVYIEIASGCAQLHAMYQAMNCGPSSYCEKYCYSPHITLAQNLPAESVRETFEKAAEAWRRSPFDRTFRVETLSFVQNTTSCRWIDLEHIPLVGIPPMPTRRAVAEPLHRV